MSGGVDSSVAAALLVEQGHDVVGATLKLWGGAVGLGLLLGGRRRGRPPGGPAARHRPPRLQPHRGVRPPRRRALRRRARPGADAQPVHRVQPLPQVRPAARPGRAPRLRPPGHRAPRPGDRTTTAASAAAAGRRPGEGPVLRAVHAGPGRAGPCALPGRRDDQGTRCGRRRAASACAPRPSPTARTSASSAAPRAARGSWPAGWSCTAAEVVDAEGRPAGSVDAVELVTVGQRRGMGHGSDGRRRYVTHVDVASRRVTVGRSEDVVRSSVVLARHSLTWVDRPLAAGARAVAQVSAHGRPVPCTVELGDDLVVRFDDPQRRWRPGRPWPSTTRSTPTPWSARASPPDRWPDDDGGRRRAVEELRRAHRAPQRALPRARRAGDPRRRVRPARRASCASSRRSTPSWPRPTRPPTPWAPRPRASSRRSATGCR